MPYTEHKNANTLLTTISNPAKSSHPPAFAPPALELASRGVRGIRAVDGGHDALRQARALALLSNAEHLLRERSAISAH